MHTPPEESTMSNESALTQHMPAGNGAANPAIFQGDVIGAFPLLVPATSHTEEIERIAANRKEQSVRLLSLRETILKSRGERVAEEDRQLEAIATELGEVHDPNVAAAVRVRVRVSASGAIGPIRRGLRAKDVISNAASPAKPGVPRTKKAGRLARRSDEQIDALVDKVVALVKKAPEGLRAEAIREALHLEAKELPRVFARAKERKVLKSKGLKRATTYLARG